MDRKPFLLAGILLVLLLAIGAAVSLVEQAENATSADTPGVTQIPLPKNLREASGLARFGNYLLVHNDEQARVYSVSLETMELGRLLSFGKPVVKSDIEGIAVRSETVYIVNSQGMLYTAPQVSIGTGHQVFSPRAVDTGLGNICEVEGLHYDAIHDREHDGGRLLLVCKTIFADKKGKIAIYSYAVDEQLLELFLEIEDSRLKGARARPTALGSDDGFYYVLTGSDVIRISRTDFAIEFLPLDRGRHSQPEGIAVMDDGSLFLVDDVRKGRSKLTRYERIELIEAN